MTSKRRLGGRHVVAASLEVKASRLRLLALCMWSGKCREFCQIQMCQACWDLLPELLAFTCVLWACLQHLELWSCDRQQGVCFTFTGTSGFSGGGGGPNGPERQHQRRRCPLSSPLGAHLEMSLGFTAHEASSPAAAPPPCIWAVASWVQQGPGAGESGPTSPRSHWRLGGCGGVEPAPPGRCAAHQVTHPHGPPPQLRQL